MAWHSKNLSRFCLNIRTFSSPVALQPNLSPGLFNPAPPNILCPLPKFPNNSNTGNTYKETIHTSTAIETRNRSFPTVSHRSQSTCLLIRSVRQTRIWKIPYSLLRNIKMTSISQLRKHFVCTDLKMGVTRPSNGLTRHPGNSTPWT